MKYDMRKDGTGGLIVFCLCEYNYFENCKKRKFSIAYIVVRDKYSIERDNQIFDIYHYPRDCPCFFEYNKNDMDLWGGLLRIGGVDALYEHLRNKYEI